MERKHGNKGFNTGLAIGSSLAVLCMLFVLAIIFIPPLAAAISASLLTIKILEALFACNAFLMALGTMTLQDPSMRKQAQLSDDKPHYPLALGLFGFPIAYAFAGLGKLIEKGWRKLFGTEDRSTETVASDSTSFIINASKAEGSRLQGEKQYTVRPEEHTQCASRRAGKENRASRRPLRGLLSTNGDERRHLAQHPANINHESWVSPRETLMDDSHPTNNPATEARLPFR